jgi:hypothetical protein
LSKTCRSTATSRLNTVWENWPIEQQTATNSSLPANKIGILMHVNLWLTGKLNGFEMAGALCASLTLHVALVLILASTSVSYPASGAETRFDVLWATPTALPVDVAQTAGADSQQGLPGLAQKTGEPEFPMLPKSTDRILPSPPSQVGAASSGDLIIPEYLPVKPMPQTKRVETKVPVLVNNETGPGESVAPRSQPPVPAGASLAKLKPNSPQAPRPAAPNAEARQGKGLQTDQKQIGLAKPGRVSAALDKEQMSQAGVQDRDPRQGQLSSVQKDNDPKPALRPEIARTAVENAKKENVPDKVLPARKQLRAKRQPEPRVHTEKEIRQNYEHEITPAKDLEGEKKAAAYTLARIEEMRLTAVRQLVAPDPALSGLPGARRPTEPQPHAAQKLQVSPHSGKSATAEDRAAVAPPLSAIPAARLKAPDSAEKPHQPRGPVIATLHGDLKLVMTGDTGIKVTVKFRDYPKSRRKTTLTRSEVRREQTVTPLLAATREDTREAVIQTAREGIYLFSAEPAGGREVRASFTLKVFESGARERIAALGNRSLSGPSVLVKILMPEAILWDDESAFTGSMEDSESETKFNAITGLYWKEFRD